MIINNIMLTIILRSRLCNCNILRMDFIHYSLTCLCSVRIPNCTCKLQNFRGLYYQFSSSVYNFFVLLLPIKLNATFFFNILLHTFDGPALSVVSVSILYVRVAVVLT